MFIAIYNSLTKSKKSFTVMPTMSNPQMRILTDEVWHLNVFKVSWTSFNSLELHNSGQYCENGRVSGPESEKKRENWYYHRPNRRSGLNGLLAWQLSHSTGRITKLIVHCTPLLDTRNPARIYGVWGPDQTGANKNLNYLNKNVTTKLHETPLVLFDALLYCMCHFTLQVLDHVMVGIEGIAKERGHHLIRERCAD